MDVHENLAFNFDRSVEEYEKSNRIERLRKQIVGLAKGKILETGVGTSRNMRFYPEGSDVLGVDWSLRMLEVAQFKNFIGIKPNYKREDVENLSFPNSTFDTVVDTFGLEYYENPEKAISEMKRVLKKNGYLLIIASGKSKSPLLDYFLMVKRPYYLLNFGYDPTKDWDSFFLNDPSLYIVQKGRIMSGTIYFYIMKKIK